MAGASRNKEEMTFWEHLDEFRKVIFRSAIVLILLMVVVFVNKNFVFETIIFAPEVLILSSTGGWNHLPCWQEYLPWVRNLSCSICRT